MPNDCYDRGIGSYAYKMVCPTRTQESLMLLEKSDIYEIRMDEKT